MSDKRRVIVTIHHRDEYSLHQHTERLGHTAYHVGLLIQPKSLGGGDKTSQAYFVTNGSKDRGRRNQSKSERRLAFYPFQSRPAQQQSVDWQDHGWKGAKRRSIRSNRFAVQSCPTSAQKRIPRGKLLDMDAICNERPADPWPCRELRSGWVC